MNANNSNGTMDMFEGAVEGDIDKLIQYAASADEQEVLRWESAITEFIDLWAAELQRVEMMSTEDAGRIARQLAAATAHYRGGRSFYLPKDDRLKRALRDNQIWEDSCHNRKTHAQLAAQHNLTVTNIYMILASQTKLRRKRLQPELPGIESQPR